MVANRSRSAIQSLTLGQTSGWINHLGLRYTSVIPLDAIEHLIPNEQLIV